VGRGILLAVVGLVAVGTSACSHRVVASHPPHHALAPNSIPADPGPAVTAPPPATADAPEVAHLGGSLVLRAVDSMSSSTLLSVTLQNVIDPDPPSPDASAPGARWVELRFTVADDEDAAFTDEVKNDDPPLTFEVDNTGYVNAAGAQPSAYGGYSPAAAGTPGVPGSCRQTLTVAARASAVDCLAFALPIGVPVVIASVALDLGDSAYGTLGEWLLPGATTTAATDDSDPSAAVAHLGGGHTITASTQTTTGPEDAVVNITLDHVIDPARAPMSALASPDDALTGDRPVALLVTLANVGDVTVPCAEGDEGELTVNWYTDPIDTTGDGGYWGDGLPSSLCANGATSPGLVPGATETGEILVALPLGVPVVKVTAGMEFAGYGGGPAGDWQIP
jgi:hypothetical protein